MSTVRTSVNLPGFSSCYLELSRSAVDYYNKGNVHVSHKHNACEIYINISGDVSFMVERRLYPVLPGSVIITRPGEFHHCIYRSKESVHDHIHILFSCTGNEKLLPLFFQREKSTGNLILLHHNAIQKAIGICDALLNGTDSEAEKLSLFFSLLTLIESGSSQSADEALPSDVQAALSYIVANLSKPLTVRELAAFTHTSINTLERHFAEAIHISPHEYIKQRRLCLAQDLLLHTSKSIQLISEECGFSDYSHFISLFRKNFGLTPLQYRKSSQK